MKNFLNSLNKTGPIDIDQVEPLSPTCAKSHCACEHCECQCQCQCQCTPSKQELEEIAKKAAKKALKEQRDEDQQQKDK